MDNPKRPAFGATRRFKGVTHQFYNSYRYRLDPERCRNEALTKVQELRRQDNVITAYTVSNAFLHYAIYVRYVENHSTN